MQIALLFLLNIFEPMNKILVILTLDMENLPSNFQEILKHEQEIVAKWKAEGILENLYLREQRNGAVLVFGGMTVEEVRERMTTLPFFQLRKNIEYFSLMQQF